MKNNSRESLQVLINYTYQRYKEFEGQSDSLKQLEYGENLVFLSNFHKKIYGYVYKPCDVNDLQPMPLNATSTLAEMDLETYISGYKGN